MCYIREILHDRTFYVEDFLKNLADLILAEINRLGCTYLEFANICELSESEIGRILGHRKKDICVSTLLKICENTSITILDLFQCRDSEVLDRMLGEFYLTDGNKKYYLKK